VPALRTSRVHPADPLRQSSPSTTRPSFASGTVLTVVQLAASLALLVGALLLIGTVRHLSNVPLGFEPEGAAIVRLSPMDMGYSPARAYAYYREFAQQLASRPQVAVVSGATGVPFFNSSGTRIRAADRTAGDATLRPDVVEVFLPGYFEAAGIPILRGRGFVGSDLGTPDRPARDVVVVSELLARQMFDTVDVIGREVAFPVRGRENKRYRIIGLAGNARVSSLTADLEPAVYEPADPSTALRRSAMLVLRTSARFDVAAELRVIGAALDPALPVGTVVPLTEAVGRARAEWDILARLLGGLAAGAALLAAVGLYGAMAFSVAARRREFGIRMAVGATAAQVRRLVLRRTAVITIGGLVLGFGGAAALVQVLKNRLVGVEPFDPLIWMLATAGLVTTAVLVSVLPARRATMVDVSQTLREV
jgi:putative ABC transport system permease protein